MAHPRVLAPPPPTPIERVLSPFARFSRTESAGGVVLIVCTVAAVILANSSAADAYHHFWETELALRLGPWQASHALHHWINDGLMAVFFFLVGLEIKREILVGELASPRRAALPIAAALGGMLVPAAIYVALNGGGPGAAGWGIPMATDIAFALGVLALMGPRVPLALKVFLAALAIVDDIGAVLVIAVFYTAEIAWGALGLGMAVLALAVVANRMGARKPAVYLVLGLAVWSFFLLSGVHATVAGVLMAMAIPARTRIDTAEFLDRGRRLMDEFDAAGEEGPDVLTNRRQQHAIHEMEQACEQAQAPLQRIEHGLHHWVAFVIVPVFALANAGVHLPADLGAALAEPVTLGVALGLLLGKPLGITLFSWLAVRMRLAVLPEGVSWGAVHAVSWLGGIGFTMSLFVTGLAFSDPARVDESKVGIFAASILAGVVGWVLLRRIPHGAAPGEVEAVLEEGDRAAAHAGA